MACLDCVDRQRTTVAPLSSVLAGYELYRFFLVLAVPVLLMLSGVEVRSRFFFFFFFRLGRSSDSDFLNFFRRALMAA